MKIGPIQQSAHINLVNINKSEKKEANIAKTMDSIVSTLKDDYGKYLVSFKSGKTELFSKVAELPKQVKKSNKFVPTFASVGGQDEAIKQLKKKLVYPIKHPEAYKYYKNKGVLLYGPPGTGKSLLAEAVGNEVNVSFFSVGGTDFKDKFVGGSEKAFEEQIQMAINAQPSILFIDEVDSLARQRGSGDAHADSLLNKVFHSMTKLQGEEVYLMAATEGRYTPAMLDYLELTQEDFDVAFKNFKERNNKQIRNPIGFNKK